MQLWWQQFLLIFLRTLQTANHDISDIYKLEGKYSLESTDPHESEIRAPPQLTIALKLSCYLFIIAKLFKVKDGCLVFVYIGKIPGLRRFWTVTSTPG